MLVERGLGDFSECVTTLDAVIVKLGPVLSPADTRKVREDLMEVIG